MASVTAELNRSAKPNRAGEYIIRLAINWRKTRYVGTGFTSRPEHWDAEKLKANKKHPRQQEVNDAVDEKIQSLIGIMRTLDRLTDKKYSAADVVEMYKTGRVPGRGNGPGTVVEELAAWLELRTDLVDSRRYRVLISRLTEFGELKLKRPLEFRDLDSEFELAFKTYLWGCPKRNSSETGYLNGTIVGLIASIKTFMGAMSRKYKGQIPDDYKDYSIDREKKKSKFYLTEERLMIMQDLDLPTPELRLSRDRYCFSCWTGLRFTDAMGVGEGHIIETPHGLAIKKVQKKTGAEVEIPLTEQAIGILDRYPNRRMPIVSGSTFNRNIKIIGGLAQFTERRVKTRKIGTKDVSKEGAFYEFLTYHTSRATFAVLMLQRGVDPLTVMSVGGWESWDVFKNNYVDIVDSHKHKAIHRAAAAIRQDAEK